MRLGNSKSDVEISRASNDVQIACRRVRRSHAPRVCGCVHRSQAHELVECNEESLSTSVVWTTQGVVTPVKNQAIMYLLLTLAMSVMAGATLVGAAKACMLRRSVAGKMEISSYTGGTRAGGLHHVQTYGVRIRVLHSSDGRVLSYRSQDRLRKNFTVAQTVLCSCTKVTH